MNKKKQNNIIIIVISINLILESVSDISQENFITPFLRTSRYALILLFYINSVSNIDKHIITYLILVLITGVYIEIYDFSVIPITLAIIYRYILLLYLIKNMNYKFYKKRTLKTISQILFILVPCIILFLINLNGVSKNINIYFLIIIAVGMVLKLIVSLLNCLKLNSKSNLFIFIAIFLYIIGDLFFTNEDLGLPYPRITANFFYTIGMLLIAKSSILRLNKS